MQLPLYAAAIASEGKTVTGVFYVPLGKAYDADGARMSGCMLKDAEVAVEYDGALKAGARSAWWRLQPR